MIPEPEEDEDLLGHDVDGQETQVGGAVDAEAGAVLLKVALGESRERAVEEHGAVGRGVEAGVEPAVAEVVELVVEEHVREPRAEQHGEHVQKLGKNN